MWWSQQPQAAGSRVSGRCNFTMCLYELFVYISLIKETHCFVFACRNLISILNQVRFLFCTSNSGTDPWQAECEMKFPCAQCTRPVSCGRAQWCSSELVMYMAWCIFILQNKSIVYIFLLINSCMKFVSWIFFFSCTILLTSYQYLSYRVFVVFCSV